MSEDVYRLKNKVSCDALAELNDRDKWTDIDAKVDMVDNLYRAIDTSDGERITIDQIENWIAALQSGKKIVNPMSPREEMEKAYKSFGTKSDVGVATRTGILLAIEIIAKEYPDVADWLKESDKQ
ncbi:hypothetical protein ACFP7A_01325 [Sporolactobacillus kofuensis]|uniref:Uncharacterized protein n=1 Tax=Sporolactobacillus kofuensis TaxID=269672 RepID=A0ABW1WCA7_9BACL|nr:hypothetical protein [Sporolactobacillus kofuensis]MCO7177038.1 hypothetical protein [Sporolactobacillus kofuensis]